jgi:hypothetical protein
MLQEKQQAHDPGERTLTFTGEALEALLEIAERENKSLDEVIEDALGLKYWALERKANGEKIIVRKGRTDMYELVI